MRIEDLPSHPLVETLPLQNTNWWVVSGGPSSGKTSVLDHLAERGYNVMPEAARILIDQEMDKGRRLEQIRADESKFQRDVEQLKIEMEEKMSPNDLVFLDRGRQGDSGAYWQESGGDHEVPISNKYAGVFLLDRLPFEKDYARTEDEEVAERIHNNIGLNYRIFGYNPIRVPVFSSNREISIEKRADFIISQMRQQDPSIPYYPAPLRGEFQLALV